MKKLSIFVCILSFTISCQIQLDGNSIYTVQGKLLDSLNRPIENHNLQVITKQHDLFTIHEYVILNEIKTDKTGFFQMNFPGSSDQVYLQLEPDYYKYDSISAGGHYYGYHNYINLEPINSKKNLYDLGFIHIKI